MLKAKVLPFATSTPCMQLQLRAAVRGEERTLAHCPVHAPLHVLLALRGPDRPILNAVALLSVLILDRPQNKSYCRCLISLHWYLLQGKLWWCNSGRQRARAQGHSPSLPCPTFRLVSPTLALKIPRPNDSNVLNGYV